MKTIRANWGGQRNILEVSRYRMDVFWRRKLVEQNDSLMFIVIVLSSEWGIYMFPLKCEHEDQLSNKGFPACKEKLLLCPTKSPFLPTNSRVTFGLMKVVITRIGEWMMRFLLQKRMGPGDISSICCAAEHEREEHQESSIPPCQSKSKLGTTG